MFIRGQFCPRLKLEVKLSAKSCFRTSISIAQHILGKVSCVRRMKFRKRNRIKALENKPEFVLLPEDRQDRSTVCPKYE